uniref:ZF(C2H2)-151 zinc finger protein n=1 Tax=Phallusia mammillata TaxID=59560 RepID=A0A6F9DY29_9ASCI|nr:ZF(C2H2)-151 zinc finger protein [Phallusia mammillata]
MDSCMLGQDSFQDINTDDCSSKLVNILIPASTLNEDVTEFVSLDQDASMSQASQNGIDMAYQQNCIYIPPSSLFMQSEAEPEVVDQPTSHPTFVTMRIENIENDGENSIYTLAPASASSSQNSTANSVKVDASLPSKVGSGNESELPGIGQHVKMTADKGTHTEGAKYAYKCTEENCTKGFSTLTQLNKHKTTVHEKEKLYKCKYANCRWSFQTPYKLRRHLESHYKQKPFACTYPGCDKVFSNNYNLTVHMKSHNELQPELICQYCGLIAPGKRKLELHLRKKHNEKPSLLCSICKQKFHTMSALVIHKRSHDPHKVEHHCPLCEKKFSKRCELKMHLYKHTGERPFQCDQCEWTFTNLSRLNRHQQTHKEKRYNCSYGDCEKQFHRLDHLTSHLKMHSVNLNEAEALKLLGPSITSKDMQLFTCEVCGYNFLSKHGLSRHKLKCQHDPSSIKLMAPSRAPGEKLNDRVLISQSASPDEKNMIESSVSNEKLGQEVIDSLLSDAEESLARNQEQFADSGPVANEVIITSDTPIPGLPNCDTDTSQASTICIIEPDSSMQGLDSSWSAALLSDDSENIDTSQYLSQDQVANVPLAPFIDEMVALAPSNSQPFLRLEGEISICGDPVPNSSGPETADEVETQDVLRQYVVDSNGLGGISDIPDSINIVSDGFKSTVSSVNNQGGTSFFDDSSVLTSMGESAHNLASNTHFSGTTINLNDLQ